jgi:hypothetical protein
MTDFVWIELFPPRDLDLAAVVGLLRPLASRPRIGFMQRTPVVIFETRITPGQVRWFVALDQQIAMSIPHQFRAQLPRLDVVASSAAGRPAPLLATDVRLSSLAFPLRLDTAESVSAGVLAVAGLLGRDEAVTLQWVVGPAYQRATRPNPFYLEEALGFRKPATPTATETQAWRQKAAEPLYGVRGRIGATAASSERVSILIRAVVGALSLANSSHCAVRTTLHTGRTSARPGLVAPTGPELVIGGEQLGTGRPARFSAWEAERAGPGFATAGGTETAALASRITHGRAPS